MIATCGLNFFTHFFYHLDKRLEYPFFKHEKDTDSDKDKGYETYDQRVMIIVEFIYELTRIIAHVFYPVYKQERAYDPDHHRHRINKTEEKREYPVEMILDLLPV